MIANRDTTRIGVRPRFFQAHRRRGRYATQKIFENHEFQQLNAAVPQLQLVTNAGALHETAPGRPEFIRALKVFLAAHPSVRRRHGTYAGRDRNIGAR